MNTSREEIATEVSRAIATGSVIPAPRIIRRKLNRRVIPRVDYVPILTSHDHADILRAIRPVLDWYGYSLAEVVGPRRYRDLAYCRMEAIYRAQQATGASSTRLGRYFNRDHGSILHALKKVKTALESKRSRNS